MTKMTKKDKVRQHLEWGKTLTQIEALKRYGSMRLSSIIFDLKHKEGMDIVTEMVTENNSTFARYKINEGEKQKTMFD